VATVALSSGLKLPGRRADQSPPFGAKVKNEWSHVFTFTYALMLCAGKILSVKFLAFKHGGLDDV
jgi:hypothetical protein